MLQIRGDMICEDFMISSDTDGIELFVRNKRLSALATFVPERTLLFVAGSTYPASTSFDLPLDGMSWMDHLARRGFDVYLVDVRGYGRSTKPAEMLGPPLDHAPVVRTPVAVADVAAAVDFIRKRRGLDRINLMGWSWGTTIMARYTSDNPDHVAKLTLIAPQWLRTTPSAADAGGTLGAYRIVDRAAAKARWLNGLPENKRTAILPDTWFENWAEATFAQSELDPDRLRAPNGTVQDSRDFWASGRPMYDPAEITVPVLIVHGDLDRDCPIDMAQAVFGKLTSAPARSWVEIRDATHSPFLETNRWRVFDAVDGFLAARPVSSHA
ncbi:Lysophospholipase, alpha-beta hydrolase superfamily [Bradyrhizobium sp. Ghvi]|uniref:alpha/beta hydrolase n=1 Tax=Bradyrhizobium sp. Ghvi TaxID=1855319 RepID=UPI0008E6C705|nr:alpha/beta fold hydrolase [Bradyrhizobium sp. Ghvi]SFO32304.1 Lysophospholipase, alpha-beta hydrolase superfamily [Bradyrhizobium sp. Ghvi]